MLSLFNLNKNLVKKIISMFFIIIIYYHVNLTFFHNKSVRYCLLFYPVVNVLDFFSSLYVFEFVKCGAIFNRKKTQMRGGLVI